MNDIPSSPDRLTAVQERLSQALARLETALENRPQSSPEGDENGVVDALRAEVDTLKAENVTLRGLVDDTTQRLDATIAKFKSELTG